MLPQAALSLSLEQAYVWRIAKQGIAIKPLPQTECLIACIFWQLH